MHWIKLCFLSILLNRSCHANNRYTRLKHGKSNCCITLPCNYPSKICTFIPTATEEKATDALQKLQRHLGLYIKSSNFVLCPVFAILAKAKTACFDFLTAFVRVKIQFQRKQVFISLPQPITLIESVLQTSPVYQFRHALSIDIFSTTQSQKKHFLCVLYSESIQHFCKRKYVFKTQLCLWLLNQGSCQSILITESQNGRDWKGPVISVMNSSSARSVSSTSVSSFLAEWSLSLTG